MTRERKKTRKLLVAMSEGDHLRLLGMAGGRPLGPYIVERALGVPSLTGDGLPEAMAAIERGEPLIDKATYDIWKPKPDETPKAALRRALEEFDDGPAMMMRRERDPMMRPVDSCIAALRQAIARLS